MLLRRPQPGSVHHVSRAVHAAGFYVLSYCMVVFSVLITAGVTGYTVPDNPVESDYPKPVLFDVIGFVFGPYGFWILAVAAYDLVKTVKRNA